MNSIPDWIIVGRFGRPHGIKGLISVQSFTEPRDNLLRYPQWHAKINGRWQLINIQHVEVNHKTILARIEDHPDRDSVAGLTNVELAVRKEDLSALDEGEYYWHQLIGMEVRNNRGVSLGFIQEILPTGANDVLVTKGNKRHLVPYIPDDVIIKIDKDNNVILVEWDEDF